MRGPVLASLSLSSPAVRSTSSQRNVRISLFRHPVSISSRSAAIAGGHTEPSASTSLQYTLPWRRNSSGVKNRSRERVLVAAHRPARVPSGRYPVPRLSQREHFRQNLDCPGWPLQVCRGAGDAGRKSPLVRPH